MRVVLACAAVLLILAIIGPDRSRSLGAEPELVSSAPPRSPEEERKGFHLPPGFEIQLVASELDIYKPLNMNFDDRGRLWVTSTLEYPFPVKEGTPSRDTVRVLADFHSDGSAGTVTTFAGGLNIPIGVLPIGGGDEALVHSIPYIYHMVDTDGDGRADLREVFFGPYGFQDTHGLTSAFTMGFDGWVYACHGYSNTSTVHGKDGKSITMNSGNTYRLRADGSHLEYFTHGQVNPFGMSFDPLGNLYTADCHSRPVYQILRGAYYPSFGKPDDGLGFAPEMVSHDHGSTAIAGVVYYAADQFPAEYRGNVFIGNVVTNRVNRDSIEWHGSSPRGILQPDFITSDDPWFRPVDLKLGPDGALYIADFYNRIIGHYEVPLRHPGRDRTSGRIWRVVYNGAEAHRPPSPPRTDWTEASLAELVDDLGHANLSVRMKAANQLASRPGDAPTNAARRAFQDGSSAWRRSHALWVLQRRGALEREELESAANDSDATVRVHAMRVVAERSEMAGFERALAMAGLKDVYAAVRRAAADALGRHPSAEDLRPLLDLRHDVPGDDSHLLHVVRMALRDHLVSASAWSHLPDPLSEADVKAIADVAPGVHTEEAARFLLEHIRSIGDDSGRLSRYAHHVARYGDDEAARAFLSFVRADRPDEISRQASLLKAIAQGTQERGGKLPDETLAWAADLTRRLVDSEQSDQVVAGIELAGSLRLKALGERLHELAGSRSSRQSQRSAAIHALVAIDPREPIALLGGILADASEPTSLRDLVAQTLARINQPEAHTALMQGLATAPGRLQNTIASSLANSGRSGAEVLLNAVATGKASPRLLQQPGLEIILKSTGVPNVSDRVAELTAGLPPAGEGLQRLLSQRRAGYSARRSDSSEGARVFEKTCASCHELAGKGSRVGPQLDGIGARGTDRLIEDILDPNRNVDLPFRATSLALSSGQVLSGLLLREEGQILVVADAQGKEQRIAKDTVEERSVTPLSPMPANIADQLTEAEFYDLIAYLLAQQPPRGEKGAEAAKPE
jgi:putative heme-binding domain-containing protein